MRRAIQNFHLLIDDGTFCGVSLGYDYTAEHEWGIRGIIREFGLKTDKRGIDGRKIRKGKVFFAEDDKMCVLTSKEPWKKKDEYTTKDLLAHEINHFYEEHDIETAWDENDFCVVTTKKENHQYIKDLYECFKKKNIAIGFIGGKLPVFENSSLSLFIPDRLPKEVTDTMYQVDKKADDLVAYEKKIGVRKLKDKVKENYSFQGENYYMACSPRWIDYEDPEKREKQKKENNTKYDIMFWVNYSDDDNNYGWYTAEQIIKWLSTPGLKLKSLNKEK